MFILWSGFQQDTVLVRYKKRSHPSREMKSTDKVPVKQPGEESRSRKVDVEEIWHEDIGYVLFEELNLEARKKTSPMLLGSKKKTPPDLSNCNQRFANLWQSRRSNDSISIVKGAPLYNQHCACCQKNIQNIDEDTQVDSFSGKYQVPTEKIIRDTRKKKSEWRHDGRKFRERHMI